MDTRHGFHRHLLNKRQGLGGVLGSLGFSLSSDSTSSTASSVPINTLTSQTSGNALGPGILGSLTGLINSSPTVVSSSPGPFSSAPSSTSVVPSTSLSSSSVTSPSPVQTPSLTVSSVTSSTDFSTAPTPTPTSDSASANDVVTYTSSDGTSIVYITSTLSAPSATSNSPTPFLRNPSLEGGVFALVGIVVLVIIFVLATWFIRKRHRQRLERDLAVAVTFDPGATDQYERQEESIDKHRLSGSSSGHEHGWGYGLYAAQPAYAPQPEYPGHGVVSYPPPVMYRAPSPPSGPYMSSPPISQQTRLGGANLMRNISDRRPVAPLAPYPTYDPAMPSQYYQP